MEFLTGRASNGMKFKYTARTQTGELQTGFVEGVNREAAYNILVGNNLYLLSLESSEVAHFYDPVINFLQKVKRKDVMVFTRQFAVLLGAKISLGDSLKNPIVIRSRFTHQASFSIMPLEVTKPATSSFLTF